MQLKSLIPTLLAVLIFCTFATPKVTAQPDTEIGVPGATNPSIKPVKSPKIKYNWHNGKALLKSAIRLNGTFKYVEPKGELPYFMYEDGLTGRKNNVPLSMIEKLVLAGVEPRASYRKDSTEFLWIDQNGGDLYRLVRKGKISLYDNSRIIDEKYPYLVNYILLAGREDYGYKLVRQVKDVGVLMGDRPYFMESAKATGRYNSQDLRVALYLVDLYNHAKPMERLNWQQASIRPKKGSTKRGMAVIQALDLRDEYGTSRNAYVHFYNPSTKKFELIPNRDIKQLTYDGKTYQLGLYSLTNKYVYGIPWQYNGDQYLAVRRIMNNDSYFYNFRGNENLILLKRNNAGEYFRSLDEAELRSIYLQQNSSQ